METLESLLSKNDYPGRGIAIGKSEDGKNAVIVYFIMGRSENSRNRIFIKDGSGIRTKAFDESKLTDPHLIIYAPVKTFAQATIVTNGDQTDTIFNGLQKGVPFEKSLETRSFEDDAPNFTPRISGIANLSNGDFSFALSIIKTNDGKTANRFLFFYEHETKGFARFISTYEKNGSPLPSFAGEPRCVFLHGDLDEITNAVWASLSSENKVSLFVRFINLHTGKAESRIVNKNK